MGVDGENGTMPPTYEEAKGLTETMDPKVNIAPSDTKIEMGKEKEKEKEEEGFKGLSKEELMQFANDPFWVRLRWVLFILFWIIWVAMLVASIVIIVYAPKCPSPEAKQWWQKGPIYKSPVTDLKDVQENLDHLVTAGVGSLYLTSLLSPNHLEQVKTEYGTMEDWKMLSQALQERGLRVIVDFVPGSTSQNHIWYEEAQAKKEDFASYYKNGLQLDLDNVKVQEELVNVMKFWLANGVDGFLVEANGVPKALLVKFRQVLEQAEAESGVEKVLMVDVLSEPLSKISGVGAGDPIHLHIDEDLLPVGEDITAKGIKTRLDAYIEKQPCEEEGSCAWPAFTLSTTSHGAEKSDALTMLKMLLPGTVVSEAGEEYGLSPDQYPPADREEPALQQHLALYNLLTSKLRHQDAILFGKLKPEDSFLKENDTVFGLVRVKKGSPGYLFLINLGSTSVEIDLSDVKYLPDDIRVLDAGDVAAVAPTVAAAEGEVVLKRFPTSAVPLEPGQAKIFNFVPKFS